MRIVRTRALWVNLRYSHSSPRITSTPRAHLSAALIWTLSTGSHSSNQARSSQQASSFSSRTMSEQQYQVLQPVQITSTSLKTYTGDVILSDCFSVASVTEKDSDGVTLGIKSNEGPVALQDFSLGQVRHVYVCIFLGTHRQSFAKVLSGLQLHCSSFVSSARNKLWWMTPHWGSHAQDILPGSWHT